MAGAPGKPTVLFYGHYDVQPVDPVELWRNPPFEPTVEGDKLVARGATDDKGQSYTHVKGVGAMLAERGSLPVNVKFLVEGEEEAGGHAIDKYVRKDGGQQLAADCVVVSDTSLYAPGQPSLIYGLKGLCYMEIKVTGPNRDLHSGTFGGAVWNPLNALCHIVDRGTPGRILVPGFYDDVRPLEAWEREEFGKLPFDEDAYRDELGVPELFGEEDYTTRERTWGRPTCDVNGIFGGYMGKGADGAPLVGRRQGLDAPRARPGPGKDRAAVHRLRPLDRPDGGDGRGASSSTGPIRWSWRRRAPSSTPPWTPCRRSGERGRFASGRGLDPDRLDLRLGAGRPGAAAGLRPARRRPALSEREVQHQSLLQRDPLRGTAAGSSGRSMRSKDNLEREIKFPRVELEKLRERLIELEAERKGPAAFEDNWILDRGNELLSAGQILRLRTDGNRARLTFKGPMRLEGNLKVREEHEVRIENAEQARALLENLGYAGRAAATRRCGRSGSSAA